MKTKAAVWMLGGLMVVVSTGCAGDGAAPGNGSGGAAGGASGGASGTGGAMSSTGGTPGTGGVPGTGGAVAGTGGAVSGTGGRSGTGGAGGARAGTGGRTATGGAGGQAVSTVRTCEGVQVTTFCIQYTMSTLQLGYKNGADCETCFGPIASECKIAAPALGGDEVYCVQNCGECDTWSPPRTGTGGATATYRACDTVLRQTRCSQYTSIVGQSLSGFKNGADCATCFGPIASECRIAAPAPGDNDTICVQNCNECDTWW